ncbi:hypothetical protein F5146DRAFT_15557 [Armillaria mellea]|nr:hypothetical protein F5146DRAFT_15557 [Armillaria mellea]
MTVGLDNFAISFLSLMGTAPGGGMGRPSASRAGGVGFGKVRGLRGVGEGSASINERIFSARVIGSSLSSSLSSSSSPIAASGVFSVLFRTLASCLRRSKGRTFSAFVELSGECPDGTTAFTASAPTSSGDSPDTASSWTDSGDTRVCFSLGEGTLCTGPMEAAESEEVMKGEREKQLGSSVCSL